MIKIAAVSWGLPGGGFYAAEVAKEVGLDGVQLELGSYATGFALSQKTIQTKWMRDRDMLNIAYPSIVLNDIMVHEFIHGGNTANGKIAYAQIKLGIETAAAMGVEVVMIPNFENNLITNQQHVKETKKALLYACDYALERNIIIATETALTNKAHLDLIREISKPNLKIFFDSMNYKYFSSLNQMTEFQALFPYLLPQIHFKDGIDAPGGSLLGTGNMEIKEQLEFLKAMNYDGWIISENYYNQRPLRDLNPSSQIELLKKDLTYIRSIL